MPTMKFTLRSLFLAVTFSCAGGVACAQSGDTIVQIPTAQGSVLVEVPTARKQAADSNSDTDITMAGEYKSTKNVVQAEKESLSWTLNFQTGYWSEYLFRGTNLTPNSDGIEYQQAYFSIESSTVGRFTVGLWFAGQLGKAVVPNATVVGEAGGGFSPFGRPGFQDFATQYRFKELDFFTSYSHSFGPLDVTVGNIAFFIFRSEVDRFLGPNSEVDYAVPENETFDRVFISLSTTKIHPFGISIIPTVTYYQTIYNHVDPIRGPGEFNPQYDPALGCTSSNPCSDSFYDLNELGFTRNDKLGGYLEGKVQAVIPIVEKVLRLQPTALISYSAGDRSEATGITQAQFLMHPASSSRPLYGFNHFQGGAELVLQITRELSLSGFGNYAYHIANPTAGTLKNEEWWGVYGTLSF